MPEELFELHLFRQVSDSYTPYIKLGSGDRESSRSFTVLETVHYIPSRFTTTSSSPVTVERTRNGFVDVGQEKEFVYIV